MARNCKCFDESSVYYLKLRAHHMWSCNYHTLLVKFYIVPFVLYCTQLFAYRFLSKTSKLMSNRQTDFVIEQAKILAFLMLEAFVFF